MSALRASPAADRSQTAVRGAFRRQDILLGRLSNGAGAGAVIEVPGRQDRVGRWVVEGDRYLIELEAAADLMQGMVRLRVNLPSGVHGFAAWLRPVGEQRTEVFPCNKVDVQERRGATRVPVDLPGKICTPDEASLAEVTVRDLSVTGAGFSGQTHLSVGGSAVLRVEGDLGGVLGPLSGEIVWRQPEADPARARYGMHFAGRTGLNEHIYAWLSAWRRS